MSEFEPIYRDHANLFRAILARISVPNKLPLQRFAMILTHADRGFMNACVAVPNEQCAALMCRGQLH
jgi:hypothetical protein